MKFHFITIVWGHEFVDFFLWVTLQNQLSAGNLPAFAGTDATYKIYTDEQDAKTIRASESFHRLSRLLKTDIITIDHLQHSNKYVRMTFCHKWALHDAYQANAKIVLLPSDVIYSKNSFAHLLSVALLDKPVIMMAAPRILRESFIPELANLFFSQSDRTIAANSRELLRLAMHHLHPVATSFFHNTENASTWPSQLFFEVPHNGFIAHCFHLHPLLITPRQDGNDFNITIDADYLLKSYPDANQIHIIDDSDDFLAVEPCPSEYGPTLSNAPYNLFSICQWASSHADAHHLNFVRHPIRYHYTDIDSKWRTTEKLAMLFVDTILKYTTGKQY